MRISYIILKITLQITFGIYFKNARILNKSANYRESTIFISNHPSAFLDPLVVSALQNPIVHFMVRADIFKSWLMPFFNIIHLIPIYRHLDGGKDALDKNEASFQKAYRALIKKKGLIIFGEGFTDDTFIRRLKPIKKGPARIAIDTMEKVNWDLDLNLQCVGLNYTNPNQTRSDVIVNYSEKIPVQNFKPAYDENPNKAITQISQWIKSNLKEQITHVEDQSKADLHENIMRLTHKGMNAFDSDKSITLEERFAYSQNLAKTINTVDWEKDQEWNSLIENTERYFEKLDQLRLTDTTVETGEKIKPSLLKHRLIQLLASPFLALALIHCAIPYYLTKSFVEKIFKRKVFWGGVKMMMGKFVLAIFNIILFFAFWLFLPIDLWMLLIYFLIIPILCGVITYDNFILRNRKIKEIRIWNQLEPNLQKKLFQQRKQLMDQLSKLEVD